ncbi:MAG TPA: molybdopterin-dependent oxidoreductase [Thermoanaerobaculia bacterium]|nr:molybdopterin-dependent oxidoreductase [Thermoanaerobaculia bacterium]
MNTLDANRREFLKTSGTALAGAAVLPGFLDGIVRRASGPVPLADTTTQIISDCAWCGSACGMKATVSNGVLTFVEGLPEDLQGGGKMCAKGKAAPGYLYDPDRLKYPMKRTNPVKGIGKDPGWVRITWDEALDLATAKLKETIEKNGRDSVMILGLASPDVWARFQNCIGTSNRFDHWDECFLSNRVISVNVIGGFVWCHDFANAKYIMTFGWDLVGKAKVVWARAVTDAKKKGAKIVSFNPYKASGTSVVADEAISIRPGSDLAVVNAMIHVILRDNLYDKAFVDAYTNFPQYETEIRAHFAPYTPEWAEALSDVPAADIARIAREFATTRPAIAPIHKKTPSANYANGTETSFAITLLNVFAGTIDRPGGRYFPRTHTIPGIDAIVPPPAYPTKSGIDIVGRSKHPFLKAVGSGMFSCLADGMRKNPGKIQMGIITRYSTMAFPNPPEVEAELVKIPFTVCCDIFPNEIIELADVVLPSALYLEVSDLVARDHHAPHKMTVVRQPVVPPQFETKPLGSILLAWGLKAFPEYWKNPDGTPINMGYVLDEKTKRAGLGANFAEMKAKGFVVEPAPFVPRTTFPTTSGKINVYVKAFADAGFEPLPTWKQKRDVPSSQYPFYLLTIIPPMQIRNTTTNNRIVNEIKGTNEVFINVQTARGLGISEGDMIKVRSRVGEIQVPARLTEAIRPDCVLVPHGFGHQSRLMTAAYGKGAKDAILVPGQSMDDILARKDVGGSACIMDAVVSLAKV